MAVYKGGQKIEDLYCGSVKIGKLYKGSTLVYSSVKYYTFTINPTPSNATVKINNQTIKSITVVEGTSISWSVSASGYKTQSGTLILTANTTKNIELVKYAYTTNQVIFEKAAAGTYSVELLEAGNYEVYCIGGGAGGFYLFSEKSGGGYLRRLVGGASGSGFIGVLNLSKKTYTVTVGAGGQPTKTEATGTRYGEGGGASSITGVITSPAGGAPSAQVGSGSFGSSPTGGAPQLNQSIISTTLNSNGKSGATATSLQAIAGGASVYNGYGKGGDVSNKGAGTAGTAGYVKIVWKG